MKHKLILILFSILGLIQPTHAQYRTLDLLGTWELVSLTGEYPGFTTYYDGSGFWEGAPSHFKYMYVGLIIRSKNYPVSLYGLTPQQSEEVVKDNDGCYGDFYYPNNPQTDYFSAGDSGYGIRSFSIQHDLLYLTLGGSDGDWPVIFTIESMSDTELILNGLDNMCRIVYKRVGTSSNAVNEIATDETETLYYDLNGMNVDRPAEGIYIKRTGNTTQKIMTTNQ